MTISRQEKITIFFIGLLLMALTSLPYLYGIFRTPNNFIYLGKHLAAGDLAVYESLIYQIEHGHFITSNLFNANIPQEKYFNILWLTVGILGKIFHLSPWFAFQLGRLLFIIPCLFVVYYFLSLFFSSVFKRMVAFLLICFSSGFGGILALFFMSPHYPQVPPDIWVGESNLFLSLYYSPHFIASWAFLIGIFYCFWQSLSRRQLKYSLLGGLLFLLFINFHPYYILTVFITFSLFLLFLLFQKKKEYFYQGFKSAFVIFLLALPSLFYYLFLFLKDPFAVLKEASNVCPTPHLFFLFLGYGLPLLLALGGIFLAKKQKKFSDPRWLFLLSWFLGTIFLIYCPFLKTQRRYLEGWQIPLDIFAAYFLTFYFPKQKIKEKIKKAPGTAILCLAAFSLILISSNLYMLLMGAAVSQLPINRLPLTEKKVFSCLEKQKNQQAVLSDPFASNLIPAFTGKKVYWGHWSETIESQNKRKELLWFFQNPDEIKTKKIFLKENNIGFILTTPTTNKKFSPQKLPYLSLICRQGKYALYRVLP